mgnify:FL=1
MNTRRVAQHYVEWFAREYGAEHLDALIDDIQPQPIYWPGASIGEVARAIIEYRRYHPDPEPVRNVSARGLFG